MNLKLKTIISMLCWTWVSIRFIQEELFIGVLLAMLMITYEIVFYKKEEQDEK